ncbi:hypothetical protein M621_00370 [Serratia plymuthica S13]|uniref:Uncharacterized protein n=1 Tax=Serratia plymuthica S13 TaxID=1348660 RepID=S4YR18_SERPL|nr:hypothetical protein M621_00370 [Serratia plymuthica S13]
MAAGPICYAGYDNELCDAKRKKINEPLHEGEG